VCVPTGRSGAALGSLSVLQSLVGIVAPLYGGEVFGRVAEDSQPVLNFAHYLLLTVALWLAYPTGATRKKDKDEDQFSEGAEAAGAPERDSSRRAEVVLDCSSNGHLKQD
jgi:hypothetical protein